MAFLRQSHGLINFRSLAILTLETESKHLHKVSPLPSCTTYTNIKISLKCRHALLQIFSRFSSFFSTSTAAASSSGTTDNTTAQVGRLNHVAIAVPDLEEAASTFRKVLGTQVSEPQSLPEHGVRVIFVQLGNTKLELLEPLGKDSPIAGYLAKNPAGGMHHICLEVPDIKARLQQLKF